MTLAEIVAAAQQQLGLLASRDGRARGVTTLPRESTAA